MDPGRLLIAVGLTGWLGGLVAVVAYVRGRMRFPKSNYSRYAVGSPGWTGAIGGLISFAVGAYFVPAIVWPITAFASGIVIFGVGVFVIALTAERRRAIASGLPEPGTAGTISFAEFTVFLSIALLFAGGALALTVYGIVNEFVGNRSEGGAALAISAATWFIAIFMGLFASPLLIARHSDRAKESAGSGKR